MGLLRDINDFLRCVKRSGKEAVGASDPMQVLFGEVMSDSPLKIVVEQRLPLDEEHIILTNAVRDHEVEMTNDSVRKKIVVHNRLLKGDKVQLLRVQGGQQYVVFDKE